MLVVPGGFDQDSPDEGIARLRDAAPAGVLATRVLAGHKSQVRHERPSALKPPEVMELGDDDHRRQRVDAAKAAQPRDRNARRGVTVAYSDDDARAGDLRAHHHEPE